MNIIISLIEVEYILLITTVSSYSDVVELVVMCSELENVNSVE